MKEEILYEVFDSRVDAGFLIQPHASLAMFTSRENAQLWIDSYDVEMEKDRAAMKIREVKLIPAQ